MSWGLSKGTGKYGPVSGNATKDHKDAMNKIAQGSKRPPQPRGRDPKAPPKH